jgi:hypothetical protein
MNLCVCVCRARRIEAAENLNTNLNTNLDSNTADRSFIPKVAYLLNTKLNTNLKLHSF